MYVGVPGTPARRPPPPPPPTPESSPTPAPHPFRGPKCLSGVRVRAAPGAPPVRLLVSVSSQYVPSSGYEWEGGGAQGHLAAARHQHFCRPALHTAPQCTAHVEAVETWVRSNPVHVLHPPPASRLIVSPSPALLTVSLCVCLQARFPWCVPEGHQREVRGKRFMPPLHSVTSSGPLQEGEWMRGSRGLPRVPPCCPGNACVQATPGGPFRLFLHQRFGRCVS